MFIKSMSAIPTSLTSLLFSLIHFIVYGSVFEAQVHKDVWTHTGGLRTQNAPTIILPLRTLATRVSADSCTFVFQLESIIGSIKDIDGRIDDQDEHLIAILSRIASLEREKVTGGKYRESMRKEYWRLCQLADNLEARLRSDIADILESQLDEHRSAARKDILKLRDSTARHLKLVDERARAVEAELWARLEKSEVTRLADHQQLAAEVQQHFVRGAGANTQGQHPQQVTQQTYEHVVVSKERPVAYFEETSSESLERQAHLNQEHTPIEDELRASTDSQASRQEERIFRHIPKTSNASEVQVMASGNLMIQEHRVGADIVVQKEPSISLKDAAGLVVIVATQVQKHHAVADEAATTQFPSDTGLPTPRATASPSPVAACREVCLPTPTSTLHLKACQEGAAYVYEVKQEEVSLTFSSSNFSLKHLIQALISSFNLATTPDQTFEILTFPSSDDLLRCPAPVFPDGKYAWYPV
ncbi:hypothetical protein HWV62_28342 [Athelia sp. TMB]|nr:hypothetical protein HWV62_28342 [Athelia sp. TMB]